MNNNLTSLIISAFIVGILVVEFAYNANAESFETIIGKEKEKQPSWYFGEGLTPGDSFEYKICDSLLIIPASPDNCYTITLRVVALLPSPQGSVWIVSAHVDHRVRNVDFILQISDSSFKIMTDGSSIPYADSLERTLEWTMKFASNHKPQSLVIGKSWGVVASDTVPETKLTVLQVDSVQIGQEIMPTYKIGYSLVKDSFLQIKDDFPMPVKAVIYKPVSAFKDVPLAITFELLNYSNEDNTCMPSQTFIQTGPNPMLANQIHAIAPNVQTLQQKFFLTNHTEIDDSTSKLENNTLVQDKPMNLKNIEGDQLLKSEGLDLNQSDVETETFDETDFREKLKNSTTAQVLKDLYGPDYEKIITSFDKFLALLTNTTNNVLENQLNSTSP